MRDESLEQAKTAIELYLPKAFKKKRHVYPSDVADALGLKYEIARQVFDVLEKEGKIV